jgi:hypothetical protein
LLRYIAALARDGSGLLLTHQEVYFELWGLPRALGEGSRFYGAKIEKVSGPIM